MYVSSLYFIFTGSRFKQLERVVRIWNRIRCLKVVSQSTIGSVLLFVRENVTISHCVSNHRLRKVTMKGTVCLQVLVLSFNPQATNVIYIYMEHLFLMFLDHTQRRSTVGRTPLDE